MVALDALSGLAVLGAMALFPLGDRVFLTGALLVILSVLGAFESPTVQACVPQMVEESQLLRGNALVNQVSSLASLVTPFLGSLLYTAVGLSPIFLGTAVCFFLTAALECFLRLGKQPARPKESLGAILKGDLAQGARFLLREEPGIVKLLLLAALASFFAAGTAVVGFPYLVRTVLGLSAELYGAAESALGVAAILGGVCVAALGERLRLRSLAWVLGGIGLCLLPCGAVFLVPASALARYAVLLGMFFLLQLGCSLFSTCAISLIQARTPERLMGKVMSCVFTLSLCAQPLGQVVYGFLFDQFSQAVYWVLLPSGLALWAVGMGARHFFKSLEKT